LAQDLWDPGPNPSCAVPSRSTQPSMMMLAHRMAFVMAAFSATSGHADNHQTHGHSKNPELHNHEHHHGQSHGHDHGHIHHNNPEPSAQPKWLLAYLSAGGISALSFVGVALLAFLHMPGVGPIIEYTCLAFAGAVLVADALLHLLPHALEGVDHSQVSGIGISSIAGSFMLLVVPELCDWHRHKHGHAVEPAGIANLLVEMLHNFVDGIAIGLSWLASPAAGLEATLAVAAHELPQELGDFMVLRAAGFPVGSLLMWNFAASLTCVGGVAVVHFTGQEATAGLQRHLMGFTAGSFLTLALNMIYPQVQASICAHHQGQGRVRAKLLCLSVAIIAIAVLLKVGNLESGHMHGHPEHEGHHHDEF